MASIRVERGSGGCVVVAEGDLDMTITGELEAALEEASAEAPKVVMDLAATSLLDSRAIGVLLSWNDRLQRIDGGLAIVGAGPDVRRLFSTIGLEREFRFFPTRSDALQD